MFDFLRNVTKSAGAKRQEALAAYLDNALSPRARNRFEAQLAQDAGLRAELEQQRAIRQMLRRLPSRPVPRNFTLDPALYGRPARQPLLQYYPALRVATVLTAVLLFIATGLGIYTSGDDSIRTAMDVAMEAPLAAPAQEQAMPATTLETVIIVTRVVTEITIETAEEEGAGEAEAGASVADEAAPLASAPAFQATTAPLPPTLASPAATASPAAPASPAVTATQSTLPRPAATVAAELAERAATVEPAATLAYLLEQTVVALSDGDTAVIAIQPTVAIVSAEEEETRVMIAPLAVAQAGLLLLLVVLTAVTLYARRKLSPLL